MRWHVATLVVLLGGSLAGAVHVPGGEPGTQEVPLARTLPLEIDVQPESHSGFDVVADGALAVTAGVGLCNKWDPTIPRVPLLASCGNAAPSRLRLYAGPSPWRLVDHLDLPCTSNASTPDMDLEGDLLAVAQPCATRFEWTLLRNIGVEKEGTVRLVEFDADGVASDVQLWPADPMRSETFGEGVDVENGVVWISSVGRKDASGESEEPDLLVPYRRADGVWEAGRPTIIHDAMWFPSPAMACIEDGCHHVPPGRGAPFVMEQGWLFVPTWDGWQPYRSLGSTWYPSGDLLPGRSWDAVAADGDRLVVANRTHATVYRLVDDDWLVEQVLPTPAAGSLEPVHGIDLRGRHLLLGQPSPRLSFDQQRMAHDTPATYMYPASAGDNASAWVRDATGWVEAHRYTTLYDDDGLGMGAALAGGESLLGAPLGPGRRDGVEPHGRSNGYLGSTYATDLPDVPTAAMSLRRESELSLTPVEFRSLATDPDDDLAVWSWDVGDDGTVDGNGPRWRTEFPRSGSVDVRHTVIDRTGLRDSVVRTFEVTNRPPVADFGPLDGVVFRMAERTVFDRSGDPDGDVVAWQWSSSDGRTSTDRDPTWLFDELGPVEVTLTVTDNLGATGTRTKTVQVVNHPPVVTITHSRPGLTFEPVTFTVDVDDPDGVVTSWRWLHPDAPDDRNWTRTWDTPGLKTVEAEAIDDDGGRTKARVTVPVGNRPPVADFDLPGHVPTGTYVTPRDASHDPDGSVRRWTWTWDGRETHDPRPRLSWDAPGTYEVGLVVTDEHGATSTRHAVELVVDNRPPVARITSYWDPAGRHVVHDDSTDPDGAVVGRTWTVDGVPLEDAGEEVLLEGVVRVTLRVEDEHGANDTAIRYLRPPMDHFDRAGGTREGAGDDESPHVHDHGHVAPPARGAGLLAALAAIPAASWLLLAAPAALAAALWLRRIHQRDDFA